MLVCAYAFSVCMCLFVCFVFLCVLFFICSCLAFLLSCMFVCICFFHLFAYFLFFIDTYQLVYSMCFIINIARDREKGRSESSFVRLASPSTPNLFAFLSFSFSPSLFCFSLAILPYLCLHFLSVPSSPFSYILPPFLSPSRLSSTRSFPSPSPLPSSSLSFL